jgi:hypothetical protein
MVSSCLSLPLLLTTKRTVSPALNVRLVWSNAYSDISILTVRVTRLGSPGLPVDEVPWSCARLVPTISMSDSAAMLEIILFIFSAPF